MKPIKDNLTAAATESFSERVMDRIEGEGIAPCPRWRFLCLHYGVWLLWALTVVAGAIAVAVMIYVGNHARFAFFEATHTTQLSFFVEVLPYIWVGVFILMALLAYVNLRHTKRGYRYPVLHLLLSSIIFSLVGGVILHMFGIGHLIDSSLSRGMPMYPSLERLEMKMWQNPQEGRLVGRFTQPQENAISYAFIDVKDEVWTVVVTELRESDRELLDVDTSVRLLGTTTDRTNRIFHACGVFRWMFAADKDMPTKELSAQRQQFINRMYEHKEADDRLRAYEADTFPNKPLDGKPFMDGLCAELAAVKRVKFTQ